MCKEISHNQFLEILRYNLIIISLFINKFEKFQKTVKNDTFDFSEDDNFIGKNKRSR